MKRLLAQGESGLVGNQDDVGMQLQDGSGAAGGNGAEAHIVDGLGLLLAIGDDQDGASAHDGMGSHSVGLTRHVVVLLEQTAVGLDGALRKFDAMRAVGEMVVGLVEADMTVIADAQKLQIGVAGGSDHRIVLGASRVGVGIGTIGHVRVRDIDVHMIEQVLVHEIMIALGIIMGEAAILVEVVRAHLGEVDIALLVPLDKLLVGTNGGGTGSQTKDAIGLENNLRRDDIGRFTAHILVVASSNDPDHA